MQRRGSLSVNQSEGQLYDPTSCGGETKLKIAPVLDNVDNNLDNECTSLMSMREAMVRRVLGEK